jgi:hypothetical protein
MPTLRGHHLICLQFFSGEGYDQKFIDNLKSVIALLESNQLEIREGEDDVCRKCPYLKNDSCQYSENADAEIREMDRKALELLDLSAGNRVAWDSIKNSVPNIFSDWFRSYCSDCEWLSVCGKNDFFRKVRPVNS